MNYELRITDYGLRMMDFILDELLVFFEACSQDATLSLLRFWCHAATRCLLSSYSSVVCGIQP